MTNPKYIVDISVTYLDFQFIFTINVHTRCCLMESLWARPEMITYNNQLMPLAIELDT
jgi:hypothetical protein